MPIAATAQPIRRALRGSLTLPGDKSISHRALMLAAIATGTSKIEGLLESGDVLATAQALRQCGVPIAKHDSFWQVIGQGAGGLRDPEADLDFGNSGTAVRLMMGLLSGCAVRAQLIGDASLSVRPMGRIITPLAQMGAQIEAETDASDTLPLRLATSHQLMPIDYTPPIASAQVKSAILLAGLGAAGTTIIREPHPTRDHSENMLRLFGAQITSETQNGHRVITLQGQTQLTATDICVAGDPSSAAFPIVAALITPDSDITLHNMMLNPHRDGLMRILQNMGARIDMGNIRTQAGEQVATIRVRHSHLCGVDVPGDDAPALIDEYPALAVAAAYATGDSTMTGLRELRVKESDRLAAIAEGLAANGVGVEVGDDYLHIKGGTIKGGGNVKTHHDHRIAMAFLVLGLAAEQAVRVDDTMMIATSYPNFLADMKKLGAHFVPENNKPENNKPENNKNEHHER